MRVELSSLPLSISPFSPSASPWLLAVKKGRVRAHSSFFAEIEGSLFPSFPLGGVCWNGAGDRGVCHGTDGLYFDYGAFVVMGDGRRGGATWTCVYIRLGHKLQRAWSSHGPGLHTDKLDQLCLQLPLPTAVTGIILWFQNISRGFELLSPDTTFGFTRFFAALYLFCSFWSSL